MSCRSTLTSLLRRTSGFSPAHRYYPIEEKAEDSATGNLVADSMPSPPFVLTSPKCKVQALQGVDIHEDDRARLEEGAAIAAAEASDIGRWVLTSSRLFFYSRLI